MPRLFMAIRTGDCFPVYDIQAQTPPIPPTRGQRGADVGQNHVAGLDYEVPIETGLVMVSRPALEIAPRPVRERIPVLSQAMRRT